MALKDVITNLRSHAALLDVLPDDHHDQPENIEASNTTLSVSPLPGGPGVWDVSVPLEASVVIFSIRSVRIIGEANARSGVVGVATRSSIQASAVSLGGDATWPNHSIQAFYSKPAAALNLSHKVFSSAGADISLSDAYLVLTSPTTRVFRTQWTNYSAGYRTLNAWLELGVIG